MIVSRDHQMMRLSGRRSTALLALIASPYPAASAPRPSLDVVGVGR
jgi:hypothetical protein